ncbi:unnamed protein product [Gordionus sp. m RMFG-2023]
MASVDSLSLIIKEILPFSSKDVHPFSQNTFIARYLHNLSIIDPRTLFVSKASLFKYIKILNDYKEYSGLNENDTSSMLRNNQFNYDMIEIKKAYKYVSANIHPDTNQRIFPLFTMSGFILSGIPIISGMLYFHSNSYSNLLLRSHKTQFLYKSFPIIFFQWLNQTQNALFNFANKNSTMDYSTHMFLSSYLLASFSAVGIAIGLDSIYKRKIKKLKYGKSFNKFIPFVTVALANIVNLISMRYPELKAGIKIMAKDGTILGRSQLASQKALLETSITRVVLPIPILIFPPLIMTYLTNKKLFVKHRNFKFPINVCVITICFTFALPLAIAIFPQISKINKKYLEANWRNVNKNILYNNKAQDILEDSYVYFNRGL